MGEEILRDACAAHGLGAIALRYFNAGGADPEGELGEEHDPETHIIPLVLQAAHGLRPTSPSSAPTTTRRTGPACATTYT